MDSDFSPRRRGQLHGMRRARPKIENWERPHLFQTPEAVARQEQAEQARATIRQHYAQGVESAAPHKQNGIAHQMAGDFSNGHPANSLTPTSRPKKRGLKAWLHSRTKKQWIIITVIALLVLGGGGYAIYHFFIRKDATPVVTQHKTTPAPTPAPAKPLTAKLTGLPITDASINERPVTAVMIENSPDARPQAGLSQAGVVFEAVAEGGITRFLTLWQDTTPDYLGPVRSVRPYYISWLAGFDAAVAHVGGSAEALAKLKNEGIKDLDQFYNPGPYRRVSNRVAPHNMYTDMAKLRARQIEKGWATSNYTPFERKEESKSAAPSATSIDFNISGVLYNAHYDYDGATNSYKRSEGGKPHMDEKAGQLAPKVVVALTMPQSQAGIYSVYGTIGSGEAHVFQDGLVQKGTWHKTSDKSNITFTDQNGAPLKLNPGQTWLTALGSSTRITFK